MATVRDLLVKWRVEVDKKQLDKFNRAIIVAKKNLQSLAKEAAKGINLSAKTSTTSGGAGGKGKGKGKSGVKQISEDALKAKSDIRSLGAEIGVLKAKVISVPGLKDFRKPLDDLKKTIFPIAVGFATAATGLGLLLAAGGRLEQTEVSFNTLLGSVEKGQKKLAELKDFAKKTPFNLIGLENNAKKLLAFGFEADDLIPVLRDLGNISAGVGRQKLPFLSLALGQVKTAGRLTGSELRQFTENGVPLLEELSKSLGKSKSSIKSLISSGGVSFEQVRSAIANMSKEGGRFFNLMDKQSKTFLGIFSNIIDTVQIFAAEVGKELLPAGKEMLKIFLDFFNTQSKFIKKQTLTFFKGFINLIILMIKFMISLFKSVKAVTDVFGGLGKVLKVVGALLLAFAAGSTLFAMGRMVLALHKMVVGFQALSRAALLAQAKAVLLPLAIGAALVAAGFLIEDFIRTFTSDSDTLLGLLLNKLVGEESAKKIRERVRSWLDSIKEGLDAGFFDDFFDFKFVHFVEGLKLIGNELKDWAKTLSLDSLSTFLKVFGTIGKFSGVGAPVGLLALAASDVIDKTNSPTIPDARGAGAGNQSVVIEQINVNAANGQEAHAIRDQVSRFITVDDLRQAQRQTQTLRVN